MSSPNQSAVLQKDGEIMKFGVIGYGYWGPNIVRNLMSLEGSEVLGYCGDQPSSSPARTEGSSRSKGGCKCG